MAVPALTAVVAVASCLQDFDQVFQGTATDASGGAAGQAGAPGGGSVGGAGGVGGGCTRADQECDSCATLFAGPWLNYVCTETFDTCVLNVTTNAQDCATICQAGGGACLDMRNDNPNNSCTGAAGADSCVGSSALGYGLCTCSRGCGTGLPCDPATQTCAAGSCT